MAMVAATTKAVPMLWHEKQALFRGAVAPTRGFVSGRGSGKTTVGAGDLLRRSKAGRLYLVVSPTYKVMEESSWRELLRIGSLTDQIDHINHSKHHVRIRAADGKGVAKVVFRSAEDPEALRGPNASGAWLDEGSLMRQAVHPIISSTLREAGELGWLTITFTPRGKKHWTFELFFGRPEQQSPCQTCAGLGCVSCAQTGLQVLPGRWLVHAHQDENPWLAPEFLENERLNYSSALAQQERAGMFVELAGLMFRAEWLEYVDEAPKHATRVRYWDFAASEGKGCRTAGVLMAHDGQHFYIEDVIKGQWSPDGRNKIVRKVAEQDAAKYRGEVQIVFEEVGGGAGPDQSLFIKRMLCEFPVRGDNVSHRGTRMVDHEPRPNEAKIRRAEPLCAACENRLVRLVRKPQRYPQVESWIEDYVYELCSFPEFRSMDQVDASSGAYNYLARMSTPAEGGNIHLASNQPQSSPVAPSTTQRRLGQAIQFSGSRYNEER